MSGPYRGIVEAFNDPEQRHRYRVRVLAAHPPGVPTEHLPWAEFAVPYASKDAGMVPSLYPGDVVWVLFEEDNRNYPVIIGCCPSARGGPVDGPVDQTSDDSRPITIKDRAGNLLALDADAQTAKLTSGGAGLEIDARTGVLKLAATDTLLLQAKKLLAEIVRGDITADSVTLTANGTVGSQLPAGELRLLSNLLLQIAVNDYNNPAAVNRFGGVVDSATGAPVVSAAYLTEILGRNVDVGAGADGVMLPTEILRLRALQHLLVQSGSTLSVEGGDITITAGTRLTVVSNGEVSITAQIANISAPEIQLTAASSLRISAPLVEIIP